MLEDSDLAPGAPPVIVINEEMARRFWPGEEALGKRLKYGLDPASKNPWKTVVGVVADMRRQRLDERAIPCIFQPGINRSMDIAIRATNDADRLREPIRAELRALDPLVPPYGIVTVEERLGRTVALRRLQTMLLLALAGVALMLSMIGAYGVMHQSMTARTREIGLRMALGADRGAVLAHGPRHRSVPALVGLALGLAGSVALSRTMAMFLYETSALDPMIYWRVAGCCWSSQSPRALCPRGVPRRPIRPSRCDTRDEAGKAGAQERE